MITIESLIACDVPPTQARTFAVPLAEACARHQVTTRVRLAAFLAQCMHESAKFVQLEEGLYYRTPERIAEIWPNRFPTPASAQHLAKNPQGLANSVYANRMGNGDEASGDGWRFRGRGLIQLTGKNNYRAASTTATRSYVDHPGLVAQPIDACETSAWFWESNGLNTLADGSQIDLISRKINGGSAGLMERRELFRTVLEAL